MIGQRSNMPSFSSGLGKGGGGGQGILKKAAKGQSRSIHVDKYNIVLRCQGQGAGGRGEGMQTPADIFIVHTLSP